LFTASLSSCWYGTVFAVVMLFSFAFMVTDQLDRESNIKL